MDARKRKKTSSSSWCAGFAHDDLWYTDAGEEHMRSKNLNLICVVAVLVLAAMLPLPVMAVTDRSINAGTGGSWGNVSVWNGSNVPDSTGERAVWSTARTPTLNGNFTIGSLKFNTGGAGIVGSGTNILTLAGDDNTGAVAVLCNMGGGTAAIACNIGLSRNSLQWAINSSGVCTVSGTISSNGGTGLEKTSSGTLKLSGANTYGGDTTITAGTLQIDAADVIPDGGTAGNVSITGTLDLNTFSETINGLSGAGTIDTVAGGSPVLTVGNNDGTGTFSGIIKNSAGNLALTKTGAGTMILSGTNTYSGGTTVEDGSLLANNTGGSGAGSGTVSVNSGGTLGGTGSVTGLVSVVSGGHLVPGAGGSGTLTLSGGLTLADGAVLDIGLGTSSALLRIPGGTFTGAGLQGVTINVYDAGGLNETKYTLIDWSGAEIDRVDVTDFVVNLPDGNKSPFELSIENDTLVLRLFSYGTLMIVR